MTSVAPGNTTVAYIRSTVRRLTASPSESALTTDDLDQFINNFYNNDFPYAIKLDQMRSVYTFFTQPYIDRYPLDVNYNQGVRAPVYFEGILGTLFKDRTQFYNVWPRFPTKFQQGGTTLTGTITAILQPSNPTQITSPNHGLATGAVIFIENVGGMTELNNNFFTVIVLDANNFLINVDNTPFNAYTGGGNWTSVNQLFSFTIPGPFLSREVVIGGIDTNGNQITINDDGNGVLQMLSFDPVVSIPVQNLNPAVPGMYNINTSNPGLTQRVDIGSVDYATGAISFTLPTPFSLAPGELFNIWVSQYQTGRPYCLLFWNNEFTIRPVPKIIHKVEVETYLTPVQFMTSTDNPILNQWALYISYGVAMEILRQRQDMEGVQNLSEGFMRQEALVLERQGIEEINQATPQLFNSTYPNYINGGYGQGWW